MPNRLLKESICCSDSLDQLSWFEEVLFYRLIVNCDDYGRFDGRAAIIKNRLFPLKENLTIKAVSEAIKKLASTGLVTLYAFEGKPYLYLPTWNEHQQIRAKKSKYPEPPTDSAPLQADDSKCNQMQANVPVIQSESNPNPNTNPNTKSARTQFVPPTLDEVRNYCAERNSSVDPVQFFEYFSEGDWKDSKGNPVRNWKQKLITWEKFQNEKPKKTGTAAELDDSYRMMRDWANG